MSTRRTRSLFEAPKMDCPAEERLVRLALEGHAEGLEFDLAARRVAVVHRGEPEAIAARLAPLGFGARLVESGPAPADGAEPVVALAAGRGEAGALRVLLAINAVMFAVELVAGWLAQSTGLLADSLDMFADAAVYGLALHAVGRSHVRQLRAAHVSGWLQLALGLGAMTEVARRAILGSEPEPPAMMGVAFLALLANAACLVLVFRHRHGGAHMKASYIFTANDVLGNLGVIAAGALVGWTDSRIPDLVVGSVIAAIVLNGAVRILAALRLRRGSVAFGRCLAVARGPWLSAVAGRWPSHAAAGYALARLSARLRPGHNRSLGDPRRGSVALGPLPGCGYRPPLIACAVRATLRRSIQRRPSMILAPLMLLLAFVAPQEPPASSQPAASSEAKDKAEGKDKEKRRRRRPRRRRRRSSRTTS